MQTLLCVLWEERQVKEGEYRFSHSCAESDLKMKNEGTQARARCPLLSMAFVVVSVSGHQYVRFQSPRSRIDRISPVLLHQILCRIADVMLL